MAPSDEDNRRDESGERGSDREKREDNDELATRALKIQSKRYYVDVKQNSRGRFIKLVEGLPNGNKNRISFPISTVPEVRNKLTSFADFYSSMDPSTEKEPEDDLLKSADIRSGQRRIYFDLKVNSRGVFLRISSTASYGAARQTVALPAQGIVEIRNVLSEFIEEFGQDEEPQELPYCQEMKVERKRFYFDCGSNDRGSFLRISEVTNRYRSSITIPQQGLRKFKDIIGEVLGKMED